MLHALGRIIFDQTGLRLTNVSTMSGTTMELAAFKTGKAQRMRMLFMVEVAELGPVQLDQSSFGNNLEYESQGLDLNSVPIVLDLGRYRRHAWSTEEDLKDLINSGLHPVEERSQYRMMLEAFVFHKQNLAYLESLNKPSQSADSNHWCYI